MREIWRFEAARRGGIVAGLSLFNTHLFATTIQDDGLHQSGSLLCLDRFNGRVRWTFNDQGQMLHSISTPTVTSSAVLVGEGLHGDIPCHLYCVDATTGSLKWKYPAGGHLESTPIVAGNRVMFTAGDDGLLSINPSSGKPIWSYRTSGHCDGTPLVHEDVVIGGSGRSRTYNQSELFCLKLERGTPLWRTPLPLPCWSTPVLDGDDLYVALGNGRLTASEPPPGQPQGALIMVHRSTGKICWQVRFPDGILSSPVLDSTHVYCTCRDGYCYAIRREDATIVWKQILGSPIVTRPVRSRDRLYVVSSGGRLAALDCLSGKYLWTYDFDTRFNAQPRLFSPPLLAVGPEGQPWIYLGTELRRSTGGAAVIFCLEEVDHP